MRGRDEIVDDQGARGMEGMTARVPPRAVTARSWTVHCAAFGAGLVLLAGCGLRAEPLPAEDAVEHYDAVAAAVVEELSGSEWTLQENRRDVRAEDGECRYSPGTWNADSLLDGVRGDEGWDEIAERLDPVLAEHGFGALSAPKRSGALYIVYSHDEHGAELQLTAQGRLSVRGALVEAEPCTAEALGL